MSVNKVILIGNVGSDPVIRTTQDNRSIADFSIATSEKWTDKKTGEKKQKSEWHRIVILSEGLVGIVKNYIKKGMRVYIDGSLQTRKWTDKDGIDRYTTEVVLKGFGCKLEILTSPNNNGNKADDYDETPIDEDSVVFAEDDIPF